jgi:Domain of unknown function (DUF4468) with TBP-like fold
MKIVIVISILIFPSVCKSQEVVLPIDSVTHKITYRDTIFVPNSKAVDLYANSKLFVEYDMKSKSTVARIFDDQALKIMVRGSVSYGAAGTTTGYGSTREPIVIVYKISIECHEGYYIYTFTDFSQGDWHGEYYTVNKAGDLDKDDPAQMSERKWKKLKINLDKKVKEQIQALKKTMKS